jgi:hypothetical protein
MNPTLHRPDWQMTSAKSWLRTADFERTDPAPMFIRIVLEKLANSGVKFLTDVAGPTRSFPELASYEWLKYVSK